MEMEEWAKSLSDEAREALRACKSGEEAAAYCKEHGIALPDELLSGIAGGMSDYNEAIAKCCDTPLACGVNNLVNNNVNAEANFI